MDSEWRLPLDYRHFAELLKCFGDKNRGVRPAQLWTAMLGGRYGGSRSKKEKPFFRQTEKVPFRIIWEICGGRASGGRARGKSRRRHWPGWRREMGRVRRWTTRRGKASSGIC